MTGIKRRLGSILGPQGLPGKDGEDGKDGDRGLPGPNAIPADEAVATYVSTSDTQTRSAFNAAAAQAVADGGAARAVLESSFLQTSTIRRIVTSDNPNEPLEDGDLLIVLRSQFFTDFSEYTPGQAPHDWSMPWVDDNNFVVVEDAEATGGKLLQEGSTTWQNRVLSWDAIPATSDVELVMKWRSAATAASFRLIARGNGSQAAPTGYHAGVQNSSTRSIQAAVASTTSTTLATQDITSSNNTWYITRLRVEGEQQKTKTWRADQLEPPTWDLESTNIDITEPGWVGMRCFPTASTRDVDWFGVGIHGSTAPTEAIS